MSIMAGIARNWFGVLGLVVVSVAGLTGCVFGNRDGQASETASRTPSSESVPARPAGSASPDQRVLRGNTERQQQYIFRVTSGTVCGPRRERQGTGFLYAADRVFTAAHLVAGGNGRYSVVGQDGRRHHGQVVVMDPARDIAVLRVPGLGVPRTAAIEDLAAGGDATVAGYPRDQELAISPVRIGVIQVTQGRDIYQEARVSRKIVALHGVNASSGMDGAPVFRSDGALAGMLFAADADDLAKAYALPMSELARPLSEGIRATTVVSSRRCAT